MAARSSHAARTLSEGAPERKPSSESVLSSVDSVEELVRQIVTRVATPPGAPAPDDAAQRILSVNVDGRQYTLTCVPSKATPALSPREQEIVRLVAQGLPNKCIGAVLDISAWTVATHLRRIFAKLGVTSRAAMIAKTLAE